GRKIMHTSRALPRLTLATLLFLIPACASPNHAADASSAKSPPASPREFRAAWVATVGNSTWPSRRDLSVEDQKKEMLAILDRAATHVSHLHPEIVRTYGNQLWLDPGDPATIDYSLAVFMDVVKRYDIDGVHMDDYFYPYKVSERSSSGPTTLATSRPTSRR